MIRQNYRMWDARCDRIHGALRPCMRNSLSIRKSDALYSIRAMCYVDEPAKTYKFVSATPYVPVCAMIDNNE